MKQSLDGVTRFLRGRLSRQTQEDLAKYAGENKLSHPLRRQLISDLNRVVGGNCVFEKERFAQVKLRRQTLLILGRNPQGGELRRLNRLLLEDAYPEELRINPPVVDCSTGLVLAYVNKLDKDGRFGFLRLPNDSAYFRFESFPVDSYVPRLGDVVSCRTATTFRGLHAYDIWKFPADIKAARSVREAGERWEFKREVTLQALQELQRQFGELQNARFKPEKKIQESAFLTVFGRDEHELDPKLEGTPTAEPQPKSRAISTPLPNSDDPKDSKPREQALVGHPAQNQSGRPRTKAAAPNLCTGPFRFDRASSLLVLPGGRNLKLPLKFARVLEAMTKMDGLGYSIRTSRLGYLEIAVRFETGKLQETKVRLSNLQTKIRIKEEFPRINTEQKKIAQEFARQFSKWLRGNRVDPRAIIKCDAKTNCYHLSYGWHEKRMVIGESGIKSVAFGREIEEKSNEDEVAAENDRLVEKLGIEFGEQDMSNT